MLKKGLFVGLLVVLILAVSPLFAGGSSELKGQQIIIGQFWDGYDVNTYKPTNEIEALTLEYRKKLLRDNEFTIREVQTALWDDMLEAITNSIMSGKPSANIYRVAPSMAMALYKQGLLYPIGDSKAIDHQNSVNVAGMKVKYSPETAKLFTFKGKQYGFSIDNGNHATGIWYNKRLFREAGLAADLPYDLQKSGQWTWDKFREILIKLRRDINNDGIYEYYGIAEGHQPNTLEAIAVSNGGAYVSKDRSGKFINTTNRPEFIEAVNFYRGLMNDGLMKKYDGAVWNMYWSEFIDGKIAMVVEQEYVRGQLREMKDDWGFVVFPKGPRSSDYKVPVDDSVFVVPKTFTPQQVDIILKAVELWFIPVTDDWKSPLYPFFRDRRAVNETMAIVYNPKNRVYRDYYMINGLDTGQIAHRVRTFDGEAAQLIESVAANWNAIINDANK